ncbi:MAG: hypothetical protein QOJ07_2303 [Thermoleophilaceae bacterium]|nr:hypothetical protein [Thermoleophilaceae bacterium]
MDGVPSRGDSVASLALPLPPGRMPLLRGGRQLKRWRYVGVYGPELMLCAGRVRVGLLRQTFWAVAEPGRPVRELASLRGGSVRLDGSRAVIEGDGVHVDVLVDEGGGVESVNPHGGGRGYVWTRKQAGVPARGSAVVDGREYEIDGLAVVDDTAGYHARHTTWTWCAGVGRGSGGERLGWNLVTGVNDGPVASERSVWVDGEPAEVGPVRIAADLSRVDFAEGGALEFAEWPGSARADDTDLLVLKSSYRQPFGSFAGRLPGGIPLAEGYGVMESHSAVW